MNSRFRPRFVALWAFASLMATGACAPEDTGVGLRGPPGHTMKTVWPLVPHRKADAIVPIDYSRF